MRASVASAAAMSAAVGLCGDSVGAFSIGVDWRARSCGSVEGAGHGRRRFLNRRRRGSTSARLESATAFGVGAFSIGDASAGVDTHDAGLATLGVGAATGVGAAQHRRWSGVGRGRAGRRRRRARDVRRARAGGGRERRAPRRRLARRPEAGAGRRPPVIRASGGGLRKGFAPTALRAFFTPAPPG